MNLNFRYFQADEDEMPIEYKLSPEVKEDPAGYKLSCKFCGTTKGCMPLDKTAFRKQANYIIELGSPYKSPFSGVYFAFACVICLRKREYEYRHNTELGELRETGFMNYDYKTQKYYPAQSTPSVSEAAIEELRITPPFRAWQGPRWLVHCNDFMTYIGVWEFDDFKTHSENGNAFDYFLKTAGKEACYNSNIDPAKGTENDLYKLLNGPYSETTCYAFCCTQCKEHRIGLDNP